MAKADGRCIISPAMPKFFIKTYGCQMNERDSEQVAHSLIARGYERAQSEFDADVVLLNTCSVRDMADQKALGKMGMLGRIANERPHAVFGFLGCMAQARGAALLKNLPHVDLVVGTQKFHRVADYVDDRFTSPHPIGFREDLIDAYRRLPKLVDHLHLPVQSGSNKILKAMHRVYTAEKYVDLVGRVREARQDIAITTDIIVGFPGETDDDYKQTRDLVEQIQFDNAFVFRYSPRRDTPAAEMTAQIDEGIKAQRNHALLELVNESARRINERLVGRTLEVLCEGPSKTNSSRLMGRTRANKIVLFEGADDLVGALVDVRIERATGFSLYGTPVAADAGLATIAA